MPTFTENSNLGAILDAHPQAVELLNSSARLQIDRFRNQELYVAAPYMGMSRTKMQQFLETVNKMR